MSEQQVVSFSDVFLRVQSEAGLKIELQKSGKNKGAVKIRTSSGADGADTLKAILPVYGWTEGYDAFVSAVQETLAPKKTQSSSKQGRPKLQSCTIEHPSILNRSKYTKNDLALLEPLRFVTSAASGRIVLAHTGEAGTETGDTYTLVSTASQGSGSGFTSALRSALSSTPAKRSWRKKQVEAKLEARKAEILDELKKGNEEADEPAPIEALEAEAGRQAEDERDRIEASVNDMTMLDQCDDALRRMLNKVSGAVHNAPHAYDAFVQLMGDKNFPLLFCRSSALSAWYYTVTSEVNGETITETYADGFSFKGDYVDLIASNLEYLWGIKKLRIAMPVIYTNDPNTACFHFFDLEKAKQAEGEYPAWEEFTSRLTTEEAEAFKGFVWSIFDAKNRGRQCLYILDKGFSGKSAVVNAIASAIGTDLHAALSKESLSNQFAFSKIWDKRFVTIGDNKNPNLIRSQAMHSMLGGDIVDVEYKGRDPFPARLMCKVFVASNIPLQIDAKARNEVTRVLPLKPDDSPETLVARGLVAVNKDGTPKMTAGGNLIPLGDPDWEEKLKEQFPAFLASCYPVYQRVCPRGMEIIIPEKSAETLIAFDEDRAALFEEILEQHFEITKSDTDCIQRVDMQRAFTEAIRDDETYKTAKLTFSEWKEFLRRRYSLEATRSRAQDHTWVYAGIKRRDSVATTNLSDDNF